MSAMLDGADPGLDLSVCRPPGLAVVRIEEAHGQDAVKALDTLLHWTPAARVLVLDEGVVDAATQQALRDRSAQGLIELVRNEPPRGRESCVVQAIDRAGSAGVVLVDGGTHVGPDWLMGLWRAAVAAPEAAAIHAVTVGPLPSTDATVQTLARLPWADLCRAARELDLPPTLAAPHGFRSACVFVPRPDRAPWDSDGRITPHVLVRAGAWSKINAELRDSLLKRLAVRAGAGPSRPQRLFLADTEPGLAVALDLARGLESFQISFAILKGAHGLDAFEFSGKKWERLPTASSGGGRSPSFAAELLSFLSMRPIDLVHVLGPGHDEAVRVLDDLGVPTIRDLGRLPALELPRVDASAGVPRVGALVVGSQKAALRLAERQSPGERTRTRVIEKGAETFRLRPLRRNRGRRRGPARVLILLDSAAERDLAYLIELIGLVGPGIEWHSVGPSLAALTQDVTHHGDLRGERLLQAVDEIDPDLCFALTTDPEGFPDALGKSWALSIPVLVRDGGVTADRVRELGGGVVLPAEVVHAAPAVAALGEDLAALRDLRKQIRASALATRGAMIEQIRGLYAEAESRWPPARRIGYVVHGELGVHGSCEQLRVVQRASMIPPSARASTRQVFVSEILTGSALAEVDALVVQRDVLAHHTDAALAAIRAAGTRLIFEIDDDLTHIEAAERMGRDADALLGMRKRLISVASSADRVLVSTSELAARMRESAAADPVVVPNELDPRIWLTETATRPRPKRAEHRILYMGTRTHTEDLMLLRHVIGAVEKRIGRPVVLEVVGVARRFEGDEWISRREVPKNIENYPQFVPWLRSQRLRWDLAVAPLVDSDFNRCKSDLKLLEYALLGLPVAASDVGPYRGANALATLCPNDPAAWTEALVTLLQNQRAAQARAAAAREHVLAHRMLTPARVSTWLDQIIH